MTPRSVHAWVERVRTTLAPQLAAREAALRSRLAEIDTRLGDLASADDVRARLEAGRLRLQELQARRELVKDLEVKLRERRRALTEQMMEHCHDILRRGRSAADRELVREASEFLRADLFELSPREVQALLARAREPVLARAEVALELGTAELALGQVSGNHEERARLEAQRAPLLREQEELRTRLTIGHAVTAQTVNALCRFADDAADKFEPLLQDWLEPRLELVREEGPWALPRDVFGEVSDGLGRRRDDVV